MNNHGLENNVSIVSNSDQLPSPADVLDQISELIAGNLETIEVLDAALQAVAYSLKTEAASILLYDAE